MVSFEGILSFSSGQLVTLSLRCVRPADRPKDGLFLTPLGSAASRVFLNSMGPLVREGPMASNC